MLLRTLILWVALAIAAAAQPQTGVVEGVVSNSATGAPVRRANVVLMGGANGSQQVAVSDASGRFQFPAVAAGSYRLMANREGFTPAFGGSSSAVTLAAGESKRDVQVKLKPFAVVTGKVLDDEGEPMSNVSVQVLRKQLHRGKAQLMPMGGNSMTNDLGEYRIFNLQEGRYYVLASAQMRPGAGMPGPGRMMASGHAPPPQSEIYVPMYYPGSIEASGATQVKAIAGQEVRGVDFRLAKSTSVTVRGKIAGPSVENLAPQLRLVKKDDAGASKFTMQRMAGVDPRTRSFELQGVTPGAYVLSAWTQAEGKMLAARQEVQVGASAIDNLTLTLLPGAEIRGTIQVEGESLEKYKGIRVHLTPGDMAFWPPPNTPINEDGSFVLSNVTAGVWDIGINPIPDGGYIKSMTLGGADVLTQEMELGPGGGGPLKIVLSLKSGQVEGTVESGTAGEPGRAMVMLVPEERFQHVQSFYRYAGVDPQGRFLLRGVTPGNYRLYAVDAVQPHELNSDPALLKALESHAPSITVDEGERLTQNVKVIPSSVVLTEMNKDR